MDVTIGDEAPDDSSNRRKERPIWMMESTVINDGNDADVSASQDSILDKAAATATSTISAGNNKQAEDIMSVLLTHEKTSGVQAANAVKAVLPQESSDSSDNDEASNMQAIDTGLIYFYFLNFK